MGFWLPLVFCPDNGDATSSIYTDYNLKYLKALWAVGFFPCIHLEAPAAAKKNRKKRETVEGRRGRTTSERCVAARNLYMVTIGLFSVTK